jgi:serine/threonine protein kinase
MIATCPDLAELALIGRGDDSGSCSPELAAHVEECAKCREFLERCARNGLEPPGFPEAGLSELGTIPVIDGFTIDRELGRGAMGVVYLAHCDMPRRQVALKLLPGGRQASPSEHRRWLREAHAASLVRHPNIVTVYEAAETERWFVMAMEYIPGGTLADRLSRPVDPPSAARLIETIARAVHHIHQAGQLHLDLKPSNILLDGDAGAGWSAVIPKVSDFGIARSAEPGATDTGQASPGGTPSYMAPEQVTKSRKELTVQADIHGLGAILYQMLAGRPPYQGATVLETIDQVQRLEPVSPRRMNPAIPRDMETICLKCLHKDPDRRYASAEALASDLHLWLDGRPITARPTSAIERSWRWCRRRPAVAAMALALMVTVSVSFATVIGLWRRAERSFRTSDELLGDFVDLTIGVEGVRPEIQTLERLAPVLERQRQHLLELRAALPDDLQRARRLDAVEHRLCLTMMQSGRFEDARRILLESMGRMETFKRHHTQEKGLNGQLSYRLKLLAEVSESLGKHEDSVVYLSRAVKAIEEENRANPTPETISQLFERRRELAFLRFRHGDPAMAASLFTENLRQVELPPSGFLGPSFATVHFVAHSDAHLFLGDGPGRATTDTVGDGLCRNSAFARLAPMTDASQSPATWARIAAEALHSACEDADDAPHGETRVALNVINHLSWAASMFRGRGELDKARRIDDRSLALANLLVAAHPNEIASYLALSLAHFQVSKDAWKIEDRKAVEESLKLALQAAQRALGLNPSSEVAQQRIYDLQRRLVGLVAGK